MQLKEQEFQNYWCPMAKPGIFRKNAAGEIVEDFNCIGDACACFCWAGTTEFKNQPKVKYGYCGLTGPRTGWNI
jgi:hypothetical protein